MVEDKICADTTSTTYLDALSGKEGLWDHPFKTSVFFRGGVKNWPNLPTDSGKKLPTGER